MLFPIGDTQVEGGHRPIVSYILIAINVLIFFYEVSLGRQLNAFLTEYGTIPTEIMRGEDLYTLFTNMFLHGGWMHLIGNMLFLYVFGDNIEAKIGSTRFLIFYILGGVVASLLHVAFNTGSKIPGVGASGAIAALMGAYLIMFPKSQIKMLVVIFMRSFQVPALLFLGLWFGQQFLSGIGSMSQTADTAGVAWWAHIGGFVFGVAGGFLFRKMTPCWERTVPRLKEYV